MKPAARMSKIHLSILAVSFFLAGCAAHSGRDVLYQTSTIQALSLGGYDGEVSLSRLIRHGDFGLGTFRGLDGEMVLLDGKFYQIKADGLAYPLKEAYGIPFAQVTFFDPDTVFTVDKEMTYAGFRDFFDSIMPSANTFYAVKIKGLFKFMKTRSVPKQERPYPALDQAVLGQKVFEFRNVRGTIVGWRSPGYSGNFSAAGCHMHFIDESRLRGGHVLDFVICEAVVEIDETSGFYIDLPTRGDFLDFNLGDSAHTAGAE